MGSTNWSLAVKCGVSLRVLPCVMFLLSILQASPVSAQEQWVHEPLQPLVREEHLDPVKVALGQELFHDKRFSADNSISCAHCHRLGSGGADGLAKSIGVGGAVGAIKAPTVFNSSKNFAQFWNGRAEDLHAQADGPVGNPIEMDSSWSEILEKLKTDKPLEQRFLMVYPDGITRKNLKDALITFERSLVTAGSPFDRWLTGEQDALSLLELRGYRLFKSYGCVSCHQGQNVGGNMFAYMGAMGDYFADRGGEVTDADLGRYMVTGKPEDRHFFKVPSLRLAALNSPYFHDGSAGTLKDAVRIMAKYQLGRSIPDEELEAITAFLASLVGNHPLLGP
jgi:cytochrome c peroxidase